MAYRYQENNIYGLIEALEDAGILTNRTIRNAMLLISRQEFVPEEYKDVAFNDRPLRIEELGFNVSAPHVYAVCLEALEIKPGNSFLDIGSGSGLMTALGGYLTGEGGSALGLDILDDAVSFSKSTVQRLTKKGLPLGNVAFEKRNVFIPDLQARKFDRIHSGAAVSQKRKHMLYELLAPGGIIVTPVGSHLIKAVKDLNGFTKEYKILDVRYSELISPSEEEILEFEKNHIFVPVRHMSNDYSKMYNNKFLSDVNFIVQGTTIYAHKIILASRCDYFSFFFNSGMGDSQISTINITEYTKHSFTEFLKFIYTGACNPTSAQVAVELLYLGDFYQMDSLKSYNEMVLSQNLSLDNVCSLLEASYLVNANQLKRVVVEYVIDNFENISQTAEFRELPFDCLKEIMSITVNRLR